jgi:hypothetical protein
LTFCQRYNRARQSSLKSAVAAILRVIEREFERFELTKLHGPLISSHCQGTGKQP